MKAWAFPVSPNNMRGSTLLLSVWLELPGAWTQVGRSLITMGGSTRTLQTSVQFMTTLPLPKNWKVGMQKFCAADNYLSKFGSATSRSLRAARNIEVNQLTFPKWEAFSRYLKASQPKNATCSTSFMIHFRHLRNCWRNIAI